ncbi:MAG: CHAP domain-containing protein [Eubacterium sp.]|nr:CHAP domain-containing protein [Eubacterium sp.]
MKNIVKNSIITVLFTVIILAVFPTTVFAQEFEPRYTAPNGEPYYTRELNRYAQTGYGMPNCVAYAYGRIYELNGEAPKISRGNAGEWWYINKNNDYYDYGQEPKLGAIVCWSNHVAVVEDISDDGSVTVSESHWGGTYFNTKTYSNVSSHYGQAFYGYIYAYEEPEEVEEETAVLFTAQDKYFEAQEKNCFTALQFASSRNKIMTPEKNLFMK